MKCLLCGINMNQNNGRDRGVCFDCLTPEDRKITIIKALRGGEEK